MRLLADTLDDLQVISAMVQDAVTRIGDISHHAKSRQLVITMNRYCWERGKRSVPARVRSALQISSVLKVQSKGIARGKRNGILSLLSLAFVEDEAKQPGGQLTIHFSDGGLMLLDTECLDIALVDLSAPWGAKSRPGHD